MSMGMHGAVAFSRWSIAALGLSAALLGCAADRDGQSPSAVSPSAASSPPAVGTAVPANLLHVCNHVPDAFRSGSLSETEEAMALSAELQGMVDTAQPKVARVLQPMVDAADAMASAENGQSRAVLRHAESRAHYQLRRVCVQAGSRACGD
jgi:hypothetical protein